MKANYSTSLRHIALRAASAIVGAAILGTGAIAQEPAPAERYPSPDHTPACATRAPTPEEIERALAAYRERVAARKPGEPIAQLPPATTAKPIREGAKPKHACVLEIARRGNIDLLFVGDSITDFFGRADRGATVWNQYYGALRAANFGISGDTTQDVLWRVQNGELEGFNAKVVVLMLGTNNIGRNSNVDIAAGDAAIVAEIRKHQPQAKILILGVFPRGGRGSSQRKDIQEINANLATLADGKSVFFKDIGSAFLQPDGAFIEGVMSDPTHPATKGYEIWAETISPTLTELMR